MGEEIAAFFGITERALEIRFAKEAAMREAKLRGALKGNVSLRKKQLTMALAGDRTMLIWLGKQRLGQRDKIETDNKNTAIGPPPQIEVVFVEPPKTEE